MFVLYKISVFINAIVIWLFGYSHCSFVTTIIMQIK